MPFDVALDLYKSPNVLTYGNATATPTLGAIGESHQFNVSVRNGVVTLANCCNHTKMASCSFAENEVLAKLGAPRNAMRCS